MDIKINKLILENFKGVRNLEILFDEKQENIYGENATGKTTVFDAFLWVLFGKNSQGKSDFNIKTLKKDGTPYRRLTHSVLCELNIDGMHKSLKKEYKEKWVKKTGEETPEFSGHETKYYIDEVPINKKGYEKVISQLIDEQLFRMITDPFYFPNLPWKKKREIVINVAGDISNEEVAEKDERFLKLIQKLENRTFEDYSKVIAEKKKEIKKKLAEIPARIDEKQKSISDYNEEEINSDINLIKADIEILRKEKEKKFMSINEKQAHLKKYEKQYDQVRNEIEKLEIDDVKNKREKKYRKTEDLYESISNKKSHLNQVNYAIQENRDKNTKIERLKQEKDNLLSEYKELKSSKFELNEGDELCKTCGQKLSTTDIESIKQQFEESKVSKLETILSHGTKLKEQIEELSKEIVDESELEIQKNKLNADISQLKAKLNEEESTKLTPFIIPKDLKKRMDELEELLSISKDKSEPVVVETNEIDERIHEKEKLLSEKYGQLQLANEDKVTIDRINTLINEEKVLSKEVALYDKADDLIMQFSKKKINMLDKKIKSKFGDVEFKMYEKLINGGEEETCEILVDGVPFWDANRADQINTGVKIINSLSDHYVVNAPIFVDNAEAVNKISDTKSQLVRLVVIQPGTKVDGVILQNIK